MTKRLLMLDDDEIERALEWYSVLAGETKTDPEDDELAEKLRAARLAA